MATYSELFQVIGLEVDGALVLRNKVVAACLIAADTISSGNDDTDPPWDQTAGAHDQRVKWAEQAYDGIEDLYDQVFRAVVAANNGETQSGILGASDSAIQSNVNAVIDTLAANL